MTPINFGSNSIHSLTHPPSLYLSFSLSRWKPKTLMRNKMFFFPVRHYSRKEVKSCIKKLVKNPQKFIN